jgi:hypothetical protein
MNTGNITILGTRRRMCCVWMLRGCHLVTLSRRLGRVFRNILRETEAECIAWIWVSCFLYLFVNILLTCLLCVLLCSEYIYVFTLLYYFCLLVLWLVVWSTPTRAWEVSISIPQKTKDKGIVRDPCNLSSVPPIFLGFYDPMGSLLVRERGDFDLDPPDS